MIEIAVHNSEGKEVSRVQIDEALLGGVIKPALLKQAIVMYHANKRQGTVATKSRSMVEGSTTKIYRQKGTGRARMGTVRTNIRKGGGVAFAKQPRDFSQRMPQKQRRLARNSAILAKLHSNDMVVVDKLQLSQPRTRELAAILRNLRIDRSCLVTTHQYDEILYKSLRNIPRVDMLEVDQLNAGDICNHRKLLFTRDALVLLLESARTGQADKKAGNDKVENS